MTLKQLIHRSLFALCIAQCSSSFAATTDNSQSMNTWFREFKATASPQQMYDFLYAMPKGGDLHHHLSGAGKSEWWWELATDQSRNGGYVYYTKTQIKQCNGYGTNEFGQSPSLLLFRTIQASEYAQLSACEKQEYTQLAHLDEQTKQAFLNSFRLDKEYEGRDEFFQTHWQRLNSMTQNPYLMAQLLLKNMQAYQAEGMQYLETQVNMQYKLKPDGSLMTPEEALSVFETLLASDAAKQTGVTVRFQYALLRFLPNAEQQLTWMYEFVDSHRDRYVGINFVGREDNDKGHPLRFLPTLRKMRHLYPKIPLALHAGEVDEPNEHVRQTLLLGADRIGHGLNTITDPNTLLLMRHGPYLIEINLISNLLLEYVDDYSSHPFGEYLRLDIPVALSTDDRGMWDSNLTDEFYVAVTAFNLSWEEVVTLSRNSLTHSFLAEQDKAAELARFTLRMKQFTEARLNQRPISTHKDKGRFICQFQTALCE